MFLGSSNFSLLAICYNAFCSKVSASCWHPSTPGWQESALFEAAFVEPPPAEPVWWLGWTKNGREMNGQLATTSGSTGEYEYIISAFSFLSSSFLSSFSLPLFLLPFLVSLAAPPNLPKASERFCIPDAPLSLSSERCCFPSKHPPA